MTTDLALTRPDPTLDESTLRVMMAVADRYVKSGLLPSAIKTPQQALVIMGMGRELGIPAAVALRGINVINGRPTCSAELMMALVRHTYGQGAIRVFKTDSKACTVQYRQVGWDGISEHTFTIEEAEAAGLFKNPVWRQYPAAMLRARAISAAVRFAFPECISGLYTPEEMGGSVTVVDDEVVMDEDGAPPPDPDAGSVAVDVAHWNTAWHVAVKGTRFEDDDTRHKFLSWYTQGAYDSLSHFLAVATDEEAAGLIGSIKTRIEAEARRARAARQALLDELAEVIQVANDAAGEEMYAIPDDIDQDADEDIRAQIADIQKTIAAVPVA